MKYPKALKTFGFILTLIAIFLAWFWFGWKLALVVFIMEWGLNIDGSFER